MKASLRLNRIAMKRRRRLRTTAASLLRDRSRQVTNREANVFRRLVTGTWAGKAYRRPDHYDVAANHLAESEAGVKALNAALDIADVLDSLDDEDRAALVQVMEFIFKRTA